MDGSGKLELTGNLGDVMKESAQAALSLHPQPGRSSWASHRISTRPRTSMSTSRRARCPRTARPRASPSPRPCVSALTGAAGTPRCGHDRRGHPAGPGAAHRRPEGKDHGGPAQRHPDGDHPRGEREGPGGDRPDGARGPALCPGGARWTQCVGQRAVCRAAEARRTRPGGASATAGRAQASLRPAAVQEERYGDQFSTRRSLFCSAVRPERLLSGTDCPRSAFAGRSNVGKSSVINRLLSRKNFARVGATPGKTTQINYFMIDGKLYLVDLPGYGYAKVSKAERDRWGRLMESLFRRAGADDPGRADRGRPAQAHRG